MNFSTKQLANNNPINSPEKTKNEVNNPEQVEKIEKSISNDKTYDDSSKNLANFFNGEIIDFDE